MVVQVSVAQIAVEAVPGEEKTCRVVAVVQIVDPEVVQKIVAEMGVVVGLGIAVVFEIAAVGVEETLGFGLETVAEVGMEIVVFETETAVVQIVVGLEIVAVQGTADLLGTEEVVVVQTVAVYAVEAVAVEIVAFVVEQTEVFAVEETEVFVVETVAAAVEMAALGRQVLLAVVEVVEMEL